MIGCDCGSPVTFSLVFSLLLASVSCAALTGHQFSCGHLPAGLKDSGLDVSKIPPMSVATESGSICRDTAPHERGQTCCTSGLETHFLQLASSQFAEMLRKANDRLLGLIAGHLDLIKERIRSSFQAANFAVHLMLNESYPDIGKRLRHPLDRLFVRLQQSLWTSTITATNVDSLIEEFFNAQLFPHLFLCSVRDCRSGDDLSPAYSVCLAKILNSSSDHHQSSSSSPAVIEPTEQQRLWSHSIVELKDQLSKAVGSVRLYITGLEMAAEVVRKSSHQRSPQTFLSTPCQRALARLKFCRFCGRGEDLTRPASNFSSEFESDSMDSTGSEDRSGSTAPVCRNFCLNVVSGCLSPIVAPVETQWDGLLRELKMFSYLLANGNSHWDLEVVLGKADSTLRKLVDRAFKHKVSLQRIAEDTCGPVDVISNSQWNVKKEMTDDYKRINIRSADQPLFSYFEAVMSNLSQDYVGWFAKFPVEMCDVGFAKEGDCWTGDHVGRYGKDLVILGQSNPEVSGSETRDAASVTLAEKLELLQKKLQEFPSPKTPRAHSQRQENRKKSPPPEDFTAKTPHVETDIDDELEKSVGWFSGDDDSLSTKSDTLADDEDMSSGSGMEPESTDVDETPRHNWQSQSRRPTTPDDLVEPYDTASVPSDRSGGSDGRSFAIPNEPIPTRRPTSSASRLGEFSRIAATVVALTSLSLWLRRELRVG